MKKQITLNLYKNNKLKQTYTDVSSIYNEKICTFFLDGVKTTISDKFFVRENKEFKFTLDILKHEASYLLKEQNILYDIDVEYVKIALNTDKIILEYKIMSDEEYFKIELLFS